MKPKEPDVVAAPIDTKPPPATTVAAQTPDPTEAPPVTAAPAAPEPAPAAATTGGSAPKPQTGTGTGSGTTGGKPAPVKDPCAACLAAAGNPSAAVGHLNACTDAGQKAKCSAAIKSQAPGAVQGAAFNGHCDQAKAMAAAAQGIGVSPRTFAAALKACK
jgi:hypothetical protein